MRCIMRRRGLPRALGAVLAAVALGLLFGAGTPPAPATAAQTGTVTIQKQLVLPNGMMVMGGDLSGYSFTITRSGTTTPIMVGPTDAMGMTLPISLPAGDYFITEQPRPGSTLVRFTIGGMFIGAPSGFFAVTGGSTTTITAVNQVPGNSSIAITKQIVDAQGNPVPTADRSGFVFQVTGPGGYNQSQTTDASGRVIFPNLGPGSYAVTEQPRSGYTFVAASVDFVPIPNGGSFQVIANQNREMLFQNRVGAAVGTVRIIKELVDANLQAVAGDRSNFQFTVTCGATVQQATTDFNGIASISNLRAGSCTIFESARTGYTLVSIVPVGTGADIGNNGTFMLAADQTTEIRVRNQVQPAPPPPPQTEMIQLFTGCNNLALTWPAGTPVREVADAITPRGGLEAIWYFDNAQGRFFGFSPIAPFASDYNTVRTSLEAVFICMRSGGTLNRPAI